MEKNKILNKQIKDLKEITVYNNSEEKMNFILTLKNGNLVILKGNNNILSIYDPITFKMIQSFYFPKRWQMISLIYQFENENLIIGGRNEIILIIKLSENNKEYSIIQEIILDYNDDFLLGAFEFNNFLIISGSGIKYIFQKNEKNLYIKSQEIYESNYTNVFLKLNENCFIIPNWNKQSIEFYGIKNNKIEIVKIKKNTPVIDENNIITLYKNIFCISGINDNGNYVNKLFFISIDNLEIIYQKIFDKKEISGLLRINDEKFLITLNYLNDKKNIGEIIEYKFNFEKNILEEISNIIAHNNRIIHIDYWSKKNKYGIITQGWDNKIKIWE